MATFIQSRIDVPMGCHNEVAVVFRGDSSVLKSFTITIHQITREKWKEIQRRFSSPLILSNILLKEVFSQIWYQKRWIENSTTFFLIDFSQRAGN